jgi:hypothetical protein
MNMLPLPVLAGLVIVGVTLSAHAGPDDGGLECAWNFSMLKVFHTPIPKASDRLKVTKIPSKVDSLSLEAVLKIVSTRKKTSS